jgi:hypothetical protein
MELQKRRANAHPNTIWLGVSRGSEQRGHPLFAASTIFFFGRLERLWMRPRTSNQMKNLTLEGEKPSQTISAWGFISPPRVKKLVKGRIPQTAVSVGAKRQRTLVGECGEGGIGHEVEELYPLSTGSGG